METELPVTNDCGLETKRMQVHKTTPPSHRKLPFRMLLFPNQLGLQNCEYYICPHDVARLACFKKQNKMRSPLIKPLKGKMCIFNIFYEDNLYRKIKN